MKTARQIAQLRRWPAIVIHQQRANGGGSGVGIERPGEPDGRSRIHLGIVVEKEDVFRVGRAPPEVHGLRESEVLGQPERLASLGFFEGFQAAPQQSRPVAGNHDHGDARRPLFLLLVLLGCQAT